MQFNDEVTIEPAVQPGPDQPGHCAAAVIVDARFDIWGEISIDCPGTPYDPGSTIYLDRKQAQELAYRLLAALRSSAPTP
jgi:hypothetical protein